MVMHMLVTKPSLCGADAMAHVFTLSVYTCYHEDSNAGYTCHSMEEGWQAGTASNAGQTDHPCHSWLMNVNLTMIVINLAHSNYACFIGRQVTR